MTLEEFGKEVLTNTCGREVRDSRDPKKVLYNSQICPKEFLEVLYIYDLHCMELSVWVKHTDDGPVIVEHSMRGI